MLAGWPGARAGPIGFWKASVDGEPGTTVREDACCPIGVNTWVWALPLTNDRLVALVPKVARMGFDAIEPPFQSSGLWTPARAAELVAAHDLGVTVCAGPYEGHAE